MLYTGDHRLGAARSAETSATQANRRLTMQCNAVFGIDNGEGPNGSNKFRGSNDGRPFVAVYRRGSHSLIRRTRGHSPLVRRAATRCIGQLRA